MPHPSFFKISRKQSRGHNPRTGFALAIVLLTLFLLGVIGAYLATGFGSRDTEVQNRAAVVQDVVTAVIQVKNVVDSCVATQSGLPDGNMMAPLYPASLGNLVPNYPFAVDAPTNPASPRCNVNNPNTSTIPSTMSWASNICCLRNPSSGSRAAYNPWIEFDVPPPVIGQSDLFSNPAQPAPNMSTGYMAPLPSNAVIYNDPKSQIVIAYDNIRGEMRTSLGVSGVVLTIKPDTKYSADQSMQAMLQNITERLNNLGLPAFFCKVPSNWYDNTIVVRLYREPGTYVNPCPGSTDTAVVP